VPPDPDVPTVKALLLAMVVAPFKDTAPVPEENVLDPEIVVSPLNVTAPVPEVKVPEPDIAMFLPEATATLPLSVTVLLPVVNAEFAVVSCCVKSPFTVTELVEAEVSPTIKFPYKVVAPAEPAAPTVKVLVPETDVAPFKVTAPVPEVKVFDPEITKLPFTVFVPVEVAKVPELLLASKFPAERVNPLSTESVGSVVLGQYSLFVVPRLDEQYACICEEAGTL
jgi:hypothetical protein